MGGGGKGGGGGWDPVAGNYQAGYQAYKPGMDITQAVHPVFGTPIQQGHPDYQYFKTGWDAAAADYNKQQKVDEMMRGFMESFHAPEAPEPPDPLTTVNTDFGTLTQKLGSPKEGEALVFDGNKWAITSIDKMPKDFGRAYSYTGADFGSGVEQRDKAYSSYLDAATKATDYVNSKIAEERARANVLGIDYKITEEQKKQRINDYFASLWGAGEQDQLEKYFSEFGKPKGFTDFMVVRGNAKDEAAGDEKEDTTARNTTTGNKPVLTTDEEDQLGANTILGG